LDEVDGNKEPAMAWFIVVVHVDEVRSCLWTPASNGPIVVHPPVDIRVESRSGRMLKGETEELVENRVLVPLCPPQILHGLARMRTRASVVYLEGPRKITEYLSRYNKFSVRELNLGSVEYEAKW
jgi:hypothetical protein